MTSVQENNENLGTSEYQLDTNAISPSANEIPLAVSDHPMCQCPTPRNISNIHDPTCSDIPKFGSIEPPIHGVKAAKSTGNSTKVTGTWKRMKGSVRIAIGNLFNNHSIKMKGKADKKMGIDHLNSASGERYQTYISQ